MAERVLVAAIAGSYGVKGEVRLKSFTADPSAVGDYGPLSDEKGTQHYDVKLGVAIKNGYAARLSGVRTKEAADKLKGTRLYAPRDALPSLPDDEFYHTDLIGLEVVDAGGARVGRVKAVQNHGASDLLELDRGPGVASVLVPFTRAVVPTVDLAAGRLIIDPPEGLM